MLRPPRLESMIPHRPYSATRETMRFIKHLCVIREKTEKTARIIWLCGHICHRQFIYRNMITPVIAKCYRIGSNSSLTSGADRTRCEIHHYLLLSTASVLKTHELTEDPSFQTILNESSMSTEL